MLQPHRRRSWAPKGQTPIQRSWDRHDRLSVISAITLSPKRKRLGLCFDIFDRNITTDEFEVFIERLLRRRRGGVTLVMDRWQVHKCAAKRLSKRYGRRLRIEWLPAYAPELNPAEQVWNRTKCVDLANFVPENALTLGRAVAHSIRRTATQLRLLRSFFQYAKLGL
jgi:transposase